MQAPLQLRLLGWTIDQIAVAYTLFVIEHPEARPAQTLQGVSSLIQWWRRAFMTREPSPLLPSRDGLEYALKAFDTATAGATPRVLQR